MIASRLVRGFGLACLGLFLSSGAAPAETALYRLKMGETHTGNAVMTQTAQKFADLVQRKTGGKIAVTVFPNSQLGDEQQLLQKALLPSYRDLASLSITILTTADPAVGVTNLPFLFRDGKHIAAFEQSPAFEAQRDGLIRSRGIRMLAAWDYGFINLYTKRPVAQLADLKGMKVRVPPAADYVRMFQLLGANPTPVAFSELYMALQTGVVEGTISAAESVLTSKFDEVTKYEAAVDYQVVFGNPVISESFYRSLPAELQGALSEAAREAAVWNRQKMAESEAATRAALEKSGMQILAVRDPDQWKAALQPMYEDFEKKNGAGLVKAIQDLH